MSTAEMLLKELQEAGKDLIDHLGEHEGPCTNQKQMEIATKIAPCSLHQTSLKKREERFKQALNQVDLLRDVFLSGTTQSGIFGR